MIEALLAPSELLTWRWLLQTLLLSLGLTAACAFAFNRDALSRRSLGVAAAWLLAVVPVVLLVWQPRYQIGLVNPPDLPEASIPGVLFGLWAVTAVTAGGVLLLRVARDVRNLHRLPLLCEGLSAHGEQPGFMDYAHSLCQRLELTPPRFVIGEHCCASSIGSTTLVVPADFASWPLASQRSVLAHELVHLKRRDDRFMVALQLLARCYLFCPWLHLLYERFVVAMEEACDERAAELINSRTLYLEGLAEAALREGGAGYERHFNPEATKLEYGAALIGTDRPHSFLQRLTRLLGKQQFFEVQAGPMVAGVSVGLLLLAALTTFEFVPVTHHPQFSTLNLGSPGNIRAQSADRLEVGHRVTSVARFPGKSDVRLERYAPSPIYPGQALIQKIEGEVLIEFSIAADGSTVRPKVLRSSHPDYFDRVAIRAVEQTVYSTKDSGVFAASDPLTTGELLAVGGIKKNYAQKLFVFRLNDAK